MFGQYLTHQEAVEVTFIGLGMVFLVLILLQMVIQVMSFILKDKSMPQAVSSKTDDKTPYSSEKSVLSNTEVSPKTKAIIMAAILESLNVSEKKNKVRITRIQKIS